MDILLEPLLMALGSNVRRERKVHGWSQEELAERAMLHRTYVADVERGKRNVSVFTLGRLGEALNVSISHLCQGIEANAVKAEPGTFER